MNEENLNFTDDEKRLIGLYLRDARKPRDILFQFGSYIAPSLLFAGYAVWRQDFVAALVAYIVLFGVAMLYLSYSGHYSELTRSIIAKYESRIRGLDR